MVDRKSLTSSASLVRPRRGLSMARTTYPSRCRLSTSPFQLEASAHAPCTSTMVGLGAACAAPYSGAPPPGELPGLAAADGLQAARAAAPAKSAGTARTAPRRRPSVRRTLEMFILGSFRLVMHGLEDDSPGMARCHRMCDCDEHAPCSSGRG